MEKLGLGLNSAEGPGWELLTAHGRQAGLCLGMLFAHRWPQTALSEKLEAILLYPRRGHGYTPSAESNG